MHWRRWLSINMWISIMYRSFLCISNISFGSSCAKVSETMSRCAARGAMRKGLLLRVWFELDEPGHMTDCISNRACTRIQGCIHYKHAQLEKKHSSSYLVKICTVCQSDTTITIFAAIKFPRMIQEQVAPIPCNAREKMPRYEAVSSRVAREYRMIMENVEENPHFTIIHARERKETSLITNNFMRNAWQ